MSRIRRADILLALACAAGAAALAASEFMDIFHLTPPGGEAIEAQTGFDRHNYAILVLAVFALVVLVIAIMTGSRIASFAVAAAGVVGLVIFLVSDLPKANNTGQLDGASGPFAKAVPQAGFWLELTGALVLAICGIALATLPPSGSQDAGRGDQPDGANAHELLRR